MTTKSLIRLNNRLKLRCNNSDSRLQKGREMYKKEKHLKINKNSDVKYYYHLKDCKLDIEKLAISLFSDSTSIFMFFFL